MSLRSRTRGGPRKKKRVAPPDAKIECAFFTLYDMDVLALGILCAASSGSSIEIRVKVSGGVLLVAACTLLGLWARSHPRPKPLRSGVYYDT